MRAAGQGQPSNVHFGELFLSDVRLKVADTSCGLQLILHTDSSSQTLALMPKKLQFKFKSGKYALSIDWTHNKENLPRKFLFYIWLKLQFTVNLTILRVGFGNSFITLNRLNSEQIYRCLALQHPHC